MLACIWYNVKCTKVIPHQDHAHIYKHPAPVGIVRKYKSFIYSECNTSISNLNLKRDYRGRDLMVEISIYQENRDRQSWPRPFGSWIYNYLCNQSLSPLKLWVESRSLRCALDTTLCDKVCQWLAAGRWFSLCTQSDFFNQ